MAKRKKRVRSSGRKKKSSGAFSSLKRMILWSCGLLMVLFAILYWYEYRFVPVQKDIHSPAASDPDVVSVARIPSRAEIPVQMGEKEQIVKHEGYTVSFNPTYKIANWVAYELTRDEVKIKRADRFDKFLADPQIKGGTAMNGDYTRTGYDRGHLAPAGDMKWSAKAMRESFYFSNICPQKPGLNRGIWKDLEEQVREWALTDSVLLIAVGPVIRPGMKRLGKNRVAIPDTFYKVIVAPYSRHPKGIAFLFANKDYKNGNLSALAIPIDSVEKVTGIDFFPALPEDLEKKVESHVDRDKWRFN